MIKDQQVIQHDGLIYSINLEENTASIIGNSNLIGDIIIPYSVFYESTEYIIVSISPQAFKLSKIRSVQFCEESKIRIIEKEAFSNSLIESITIPPHLQKIGEGSFKSCFKLQEFKIPKKSDLEIISKEAFFFSGIKYIDIPVHVKEIGESAFNFCFKLQKIDLENNRDLQSIGDNAFSLTAITVWSFMCQYSEPLVCKLRKMLFTANSVPENCLLASKLTDICFHPDNKFYKIYKDIMIIGKSSIESNDYDVLVYVIRNVETITIPNFIRIIGSFAFNNCKKLQKVEFTTDSKIEIIEDNSFSFTLIKEFTVPKTLNKIGQYAFDRCSRLEIFEIPIDSKLQIIDSFAFSNTRIKSLKFPSSLIELKENWASGLNDLKQINISSDNPKYKSIDDDKTIIGKSSIENKEYDVFIFSIKYFVIIPNFIKSINSNAFKDLVKIEIPNDSKLQVIENNAFAEAKIEYVYIPQTVKKIGKCAFKKCENLLYINISSN